MRFKQPAYYSRLYRDFEEIRGKSYDSVISFYERNREEISYLPVSEQFDLKCEYADALFESGFHRKQVEVADDIIEDSIFHNIKYHRGRDIYVSTLFRKAASLYNLYETEEAVAILEQLKKISPAKREISMFIFRCYLRSRPIFLNYTRGGFVIFLLLSLVLFVIEITAENTDALSRVGSFIIGRNFLFAASISILLAGEGIHLFRAWSKASTKA